MNYAKALIPGVIARDALHEGRKFSNYLTAGMDALTCLPIGYGIVGTSIASTMDNTAAAIAAAGSTALYCGGRALLNWYRKL